MPHSLFDEKYENHTHEADELLAEFNEALHKIIRRAVEKDLSLRDLMLILHEDISGRVTEQLLMRNSRIKRAEKAPPPLPEKKA